MNYKNLIIIFLIIITLVSLFFGIIQNNNIEPANKLSEYNDFYCVEDQCYFTKEKNVCEDDALIVEKIITSNINKEKIN